MERRLRLWRARRLHDHIDVILRTDGTTWVLEYWRKHRLMVARRFDREADARAEAAGRLEELQRTGWIDHW